MSLECSLQTQLTRTLGAFYRRFIRPLLPDGVPVRYAQIPISLNTKLGNSLTPRSFLPFMHYDIDDYEAALIKGLKHNVRDGDHVVVVGGGEGVTAVVASKLAGASGHVTCFEGSAQQIERVNLTRQRNSAERSLDIHQAVVGANIGVYGDATGLPVMPAAELPLCDVLELDCEGAELQILPNLPFKPRAILVETHGVHGAPTAEVGALLAGMGYQVEDLGWAEPDRLADCRAGDIRVLEARLAA